MGKRQSAGGVTDVVQHGGPGWEYLSLRFHGVKLRVDRWQHYLYGTDIPAVMVRDSRFKAVLHDQGEDLAKDGLILSPELAGVVRAWLANLKNGGGEA